MFMSRRNEGNKRNYFRPRIDRMIRILYLSRKSQIAQKDNPLDGFIEVVDVFLKINFHHTSLTSMLDSSWRVNLVFHLIRRILKVNFQSSSDKSKTYSIKEDSYYSSDSCSYVKFAFSEVLRDSAKFKQVWLCSRCSLGPASPLKIFNFQLFGQRMPKMLASIWLSREKSQRS